MKWIGISGSQKVNEEMEQDVRKDVQNILAEGNGILVGGALGVDSFALEEALSIDPEAHYIKVYLPATLERYAAHYRRRAEEGVISKDQAETLIGLLTKAKNDHAVSFTEHPENTEMNQTTYYERNSAIVSAADEIHAFQSNNSKGTQDTIDKAKTKGIPVIVYSYSVS
ncbi:DNA-processing protein DprA [Patescibacteria group bacterium]|nr:DNA-processing protein DprA [Patescibacteria group bacterium]